MKRIFRRLVYAAPALLAFAALAVGAPHQKEPFTLTLQVPKQPLKAGMPLVLRLTVRNTSDRAVHIPLIGMGSEVGKVYQLHVLDEQGRPAPPYVPPPPPKGTHRLQIGMGPGIQLKPGESLADQVNVTDVYDLSQPGKYKVWVAEPFYRGPHLPNGLVRSDTITVTVTK